MVYILLIFFSFLISISEEGTCAITTRADKYVKCRDKDPADNRNNVCCFLKANDGKFTRCVELRAVDIDGDKFDKTKDSIMKGTYDYWLMDNYTGFEEYKDQSMKISKIDSLRCSNSQFLRYFGLLALLFIFY